MIMVAEEATTTVKILGEETITGTTEAGAAITETTVAVAITGITEVVEEITGIIITEILRKDIDNITRLTCLTADRLHELK